MKKLGIFYFIFVVILSMLPCSDALEANQFSASQIEKVTHGKNKGTAETCSPICLCTCCGQSIIPIAPLIFEMNTPAYLSIATLCISNLQLEKNIQNIWQPPKLA